MGYSNVVVEVPHDHDFLSTPEFRTSESPSSSEVDVSPGLSQELFEITPLYNRYKWCGVAIPAQIPIFAEDYVVYIPVTSRQDKYI